MSTYVHGYESYTDGESHTDSELDRHSLKTALLYIVTVVVSSTTVIWSCGVFSDADKIHPWLLYTPSKPCGVLLAGRGEMPSTPPS